MHEEAKVRLGERLLALDDAVQVRVQQLRSIGVVVGSVRGVSLNYIQAGTADDHRATTRTHLHHDV